jgi:hypothetical protein
MQDGVYLYEVLLVYFKVPAWVSRQNAAISDCWKNNNF